MKVVKKTKDRDYKEEYKKFHKGGAEKKARAKRNKRRRQFLKGGKVSKGDGKDIHHYYKGGILQARVEDASVNRARREKSRVPGSERK